VNCVVNVSPSLLADVLTCETKGWSRHVKGFTSKGDAMKALAGSAAHAAIAEFLKPPRDDVRDLNPAGRARWMFHHVYDERYPTFAAEDLDVAYTPANLGKIVDRWCEMHPPTELPWVKVLEVETAFISRTFTVGDTTVNLIVRPDALVEDAAEMVRFVDTKTTGWRISDAEWRSELRLSLQVGLYIDAVMQRYGERAWLGGWINAMEIATLPSDPKRICKGNKYNHGVPFAECGHEHAKSDFVVCDLQPELVATAVRDAERGAYRFVEMLRWGQVGADDVGIVNCLNMHGRANRACRLCAANGWCEAGRVPEALEAFMVYEPWVIEEGQRV
jgi:hypothetical protein